MSNISQTFQRRGNMRVARKAWMLSILSVAFVSLWSASSFAGLLGPAEPYAKPCSLSLSGGYSFVEQEIKSSGFGDIITKSNQYFVEGSYSPFRNWEGYLRGGGADMKTQDGNFKDDVRPFGAVGIRGLILDNGAFGFGPVAQANFYSEWKDNLYGIELKAQDTWDVTAGLVGQWRHKSSGFVAYGGVYAYWTQMKLKSSLNIPGFGQVNGSTTFHENSNVGEVVGIKWPVNKQLSVTGEARYVDRWSAGAMINYAF
jgi:hypothetical protein